MQDKGVCKFPKKIYFQGLCDFLKMKNKNIGSQSTAMCPFLKIEKSKNHFHPTVRTDLSI